MYVHYENQVKTQGGDMRKPGFFFIMFCCFAFVLVLQETAFSETGGKPIPKNNVQLGIGYDYFESDLQHLSRSTDRAASSAINNFYNLRFYYEPKYPYLKYGLFDWLEFSGKLGLLRMDYDYAMKDGGTDNGNFETQNEFEIGYYAAKVKAKPFELKNGIFLSIAGEYEYGRSSDIEAYSRPAGTVDKNLISRLQFYTVSASVISGWDIKQVIIPYGGFGYRDLRMKYKYSDGVIDKFRNPSNWYGIVGGNIVLFKHMVLNVEGDFGDRMMAVTGQVGFQFNLFGDKKK
jgi:hypothetical protein